MYNFKIIRNNTKSEEHLKDKITEINSSEVGIIDF